MIQPPASASEQSRVMDGDNSLPPPVYQQKKTPGSFDTGLRVIDRLNGIASTPMGGVALKVILKEFGLDSPKKDDVDRKHAFGRFMTTMSQNWALFFLIPFCIGVSFAFVLLISYFGWKLINLVLMRF